MSAPLDPAKFRDPRVTAKGETRASVALTGLETLWVNTGTLCNITCRHCYIDSSPTNDRLAYVTLADVAQTLDAIRDRGLPLARVGLTGGEPFMNPAILAILEDILSRGLAALVLTNALRPMRRHDAALLALKDRYGANLTIRVSLDHHDPEPHDAERGEGTFDKALDGLTFLSDHGFSIAVAGRAGFAPDLAAARTGYQRLFAERGLRLDADDPAQLVLFPEMDPHADVPEITEACWGILGKRPADVMCATSRMLVRRKGAQRPSLLACTLIVDDPAFDLGPDLDQALEPVALNHPHCARFCVLGGASCAA